MTSLSKSSLDMKQTTLCYIERDEKYLMLHRVKKVNDENRDKWIGIGGRIEAGETPFDCVRREVKEETGLDLVTPRYRGIVTFVSNVFGTEYMHLFTDKDTSGEPSDCDEGELCWINKSDMCRLNLWAGDMIFLKLLDSDERFFSLKLVYEGDSLVSHTLEFA